MTVAEEYEAISREKAAYEASRKYLEQAHLGEWVIFYGGELIGAYEDFQDAARDGLDRFGSETFLLKQVGAPYPEVRSFLHYMPASEDADGR